MSSHRRIPPTPTDLDRRAAIKWMIAAAGSAWLSTQGRGAVTQAAPPQIAPSSVSGYGLDANLTKLYHGGEFWPLMLSAEQLRLAAVISDLLIPADEISPSASAVGVHHFLNEWVSAPYPAHLEDRTLLLDGFAWLDQRSSQLFGKLFVEIDDALRRKICDDICYVPKAPPDLAQPARFFARCRDLVSGGFYSTPEGMKDIGYIGNVPLASFEGPSPEILKQVGLA